MKPNQLAKLLNITDSTLRLWCAKEYGDFLSLNAQGQHGARRSFNNTDARILAWIALLRTQNVSKEDIRATLRSSQANHWRDLPPLPGGIVDDEPIAVVPREAVEERVKALREHYETQLQAISKERDELRAQLEAVQQENAETARAMQHKLDTLTEQEAELRGRLEQYTIGGKRRSAVTLVAGALLAGIVIMALAVLLALLVTSAPR